GGARRDVVARHFDDRRLARAGGRGGRGRASGGGARLTGVRSRGGALVGLGHRRRRGRRRVGRLRRGLRLWLCIGRRLEDIGGDSQSDRRRHGDRGGVANDRSHVTPLGAAGG